MRTLSAIAGAWFIGTALTVSAGDVDREDVEDAKDQVKDSVAVVQKIRQDAELSKMLDRAKAVLIIPEYGQAAAVGEIGAVEPIGEMGVREAAHPFTSPASGGAGWYSPHQSK